MTRWLAAWMLVIVTVTPAAADNRFRGMFRWIPSDVNVFVAADLNQIYRSPLATKQRWASTAPLSEFSPVIQFLLLGARVDPTTMQENAEYGVAYLNTDITMDELAKREGGARDTIADAPAVLSPRNAYFVSLAPFTVGMMAPALRQDAAKWVRFGRANAQPSFAPPIQAAIASIQPSTQFMLVLDVADSVRHEDVRPRLNGSKALAGKDLDAAAKILASVVSIRLDLTVTDAIHGALTVTFEENPAPISSVAKELLKEVLTRRGAWLDDLESWSASSSDKAVTFRGPLGEPAFRHLISLLAPPAPQLDHGQVESNNPLAAEIRQQASKRYFQSIETILNGLKRPPSRVQQNFQDFEMWYDKAAESIAELSQINVDPDLIKFGKFAHDSLRAISASARGESVQIDKAAQSFRFGIYNTGGWGGGGGGRRNWGGGGIFLDTNLADVNQAKQHAIEQGTQTRVEIWTNLMAELDKTRKAMYEKFKVPF